jgi:hypothetical protein
MNLFDGLALVPLRQIDALSPTARKTQERELRWQTDKQLNAAIQFWKEANLNGDQKAAGMRNLTNVYVKRADNKEKLGDLNGALEDWKIVTSQIDGKLPIDSLYIIAHSLLLARMGHHTEAFTDLKRLGNGINRHPLGPYNAACCFALAYLALEGDKTITPENRMSLRDKYLSEAIAALTVARSNGYFVSDSRRSALMTDDDFVAIRKTKEFESFLETLRKTNSVQVPNKK